MNPQESYDDMVSGLARGWNTWNVRSVFSHVFMPGAIAVNFGFKDYVGREPLTEANLGFDMEDVILGPHATDGSYTDATLRNWAVEDHLPGISIRVQTAHDGNDLVALVEAVGDVQRLRAPVLIVECGILWNRSGSLARNGDSLSVTAGETRVDITTTGEPVDEYYVGKLMTPYLAVPLSEPIGVSTGRRRSIAETRALVARKRSAWEARRNAAGDLAELWDAMQTGLAWNTIYEPQHERVVCPVSRRWSLRNRGYVLYLWDTYLAAYQAAAVGDRELAYVNLVEMTRAKHKADRPFVPNVEQANGFLSRDRSQPPVGSLCARETYRVFREKWILELLYGDLREWNEWWYTNRRYDDLLCYGSTPYEPVVGNRWETEAGEAVNGWFGASMESGWDGGVLHRDVPFDKQRHHLKHWDAALNGVYALDCRALADIAEVLGNNETARILRGRATGIQRALEKLWNEEIGFYQNRNWETGEFSSIVAVNGFYPLIAGAATDEQARRVVEEHLLNRDEFWGEYAISTISMQEPTFSAEGNYWDGRVWPPVNFLVYLGLRNYEHVPEIASAAADLVANSRELLLKDFRSDRLVRENYDVNTGSGDEASQSAAFYHWGGLLALMSFVETGALTGRESRLGE